jgi:hypothetical protein
VNGDELAALIAAVQALMQQPQDDSARPEMSAWKRAARLASIESASFDMLRMTDV